jgi:hypothetical protein
MKDLSSTLLILFCMLVIGCFKSVNLVSHTAKTGLAVQMKEKHDSIYNLLDTNQKRQIKHTIIAGDIIRAKIFSLAGISEKDSTTECYILEMTRSVDYAYWGNYCFKEKNLMYQVFFRPPYNTSDTIEDLIITSKDFNAHSCVVKVIKEELGDKKNMANCSNETSYIATKFFHSRHKNFILETTFFCENEYDKKQITYLRDIGTGCD